MTGQTVKCWRCGQEFTTPAGALPVTHWVHFETNPKGGRVECLALNQAGKR